MSFLTGTVSATRFSTSAISFHPWDEATVARIAGHNADARPLSDTEPQHGWTGGRHDLDFEFTTDRLLRGRYLCFGFRVTEDKYPAGRVKAMAEMEMAGAEKDGRRLDWKDAKATALETLAEEGKDGRFRHHTTVPLVWDGVTGDVWYGSAGEKHVGLFTALFAETFGVDLSPVTSGTFHNDNAAGPDENPVWIEDGTDDWMGNDFLMWMLARDRAGEHAVGGTIVAVTGKVDVACPRGETGRDSIAAECPAKVPELTTAVRAGKLARKAGLTVVPQSGLTYSFTLAAARGAVTGAKVPVDEDAVPGAETDVAMLDRCRELFETLDGLMRTFVTGHAEHLRAVTQWTSEEGA